MTQMFDSLGWALLHSLWQGGLAMLAVIAFRGLTKNGSPSLRYNFQILCLFGCFFAFLVTFGLYQSGGGASVAIKSLSATEAVSQAAALFTGASDGLQVTSQSLSVSVAASAPLLGVLWCLGFAFMAVRYLTAYAITQKLRHTGLTEVSHVWQNRFRTLVFNAGVSDKVRIFISDHVAGPLTIGFIKPVVLVPTGFLMGLPRDEVEAILLHELAHIRRYDYLVNLFQTAIKTVLFFHPAIHYISKRIDIDREQACDDIAVAQSRDPRALVRGLATLRLHTSGQGFAMAADSGDTPLMDRLKRLVGSVEHQRRPEHLLMPLIATVLIGGIYLSTTSAANAHPEPKGYEHADANYDDMRETLYGYLIKDGFLSSPKQKATLRFVNNNWTVNGEAVPSYKEDKYCQLFSDMNIKKATLSKIEISPKSTHIVSETKTGKQSHKITVGEFNHTNATQHNISFEPVPPMPPAQAQPPMRKVKLDEFKPQFIWPTNSKHITATFGQVGKIWETSHHGLDFKGAIGDPVFASADGSVQLVSTEGNWGKRIILKHANGYQSLYGHMNSLGVSHGQQVKAGDIIGTVGSTGKSTGPHLHFEIRKHGRHIDPAPLID